jgi:hypothetical protein
MFLNKQSLFFCGFKKTTSDPYENNLPRPFSQKRDFNGFKKVLAGSALMFSERIQETVPTTRTAAKLQFSVFPY